MLSRSIHRVNRLDLSSKCESDFGLLIRSPIASPRRSIVATSPGKMTTVLRKTLAKDSRFRSEEKARGTRWSSARCVSYERSPSTWRARERRCLACFSRLATAKYIGRKRELPTTFGACTIPSIQQKGPCFCFDTSFSIVGFCEDVIGYFSSR